MSARAATEVNVTGEVRYDYPTTISLGNWPFVAFLLVVDACVMGFTYLAEVKPLVVVLLGALILLPALLFGFIPRVPELLGQYSRIIRIYDGGILSTTSGTEHFDSWDQLSVQSDTSIRGGRTVLLRPLGDSGRRLELSDSMHTSDAIDFAIAHAKKDVPHPG